MAQCYVGSIADLSDAQALEMSISRTFSAGRTSAGEAQGFAALLHLEETGLFH